MTGRIEREWGGRGEGESETEEVRPGRISDGAVREGEQEERRKIREKEREL